MQNYVLIKDKINRFNKKIIVNGDKSLSIRWALMASQAVGKSKAFNLLRSEDVLSTLDCLKKLGIKIHLKKNHCEIMGQGLNGFKFKNNLILNAGNSGTLGRLILALLIKSPKKIKLIGDKSLSKRDFSRVITPLERIGASFYPKNKITLPLYIKGTKLLKSINYVEDKGSAQCKSSIMIAALNIPGKTNIKAKKSRDHSEILFKHLKIPIKVNKKKNFDLIEIKGGKNFKGFNYNIPSDISSSAFFIVLTLLSKKSSLTIKNVNINPSRTGIITILNKMGANIIFKNKIKKQGEQIADLFVKSVESLKPINCPTSLNSSAIDEFLVIFLIAAKAKGVSTFKKLNELNQKESPRLKLGSHLLKMIGVKTELTNDSIKIYGNPELKLDKKYIMKNFLKDHRVFMASIIAALSFGGDWKIYDPDSIKTSFPSFIKIIKDIGAKIK